ncbi:MAG: hypothetical protein KME22_22735 [Hassallia sp. WJT32-NPBG1]|nr:hypothetical protein [Hassallia sp. WJT32-NPBG1]
MAIHLSQRPCATNLAIACSRRLRLIFIENYKDAGKSGLYLHQVEGFPGMETAGARLILPIGVIQKIKCPAQRDNQYEY